MNDQLIFDPLTTFPLKGKLISGRSAFTHLRDALRLAESQVLICSAYLKADALRSVLAELPKAVPGRILTRWQLGDLLNGASDVDAFEIARELGWEFYVRLDFHGKAFAVPPHILLVGSANATKSGFGLHDKANTEICTAVECADGNLRVLQDLFNDATQMTPELADQIRTYVAAFPLRDIHDPKWPTLLFEKLWNRRPPTRLFVGECLYTKGEWLSQTAVATSAFVEHDCELLGLTPELAIDCPELVSSRFRMTRMYRWFVQTLEDKGTEIYFGELTAALHASLLDDPGPKRFEVKALAQNLVAWLDFLQPDALVVDRPNYSQRIRKAA